MAIICPEKTVFSKSVPLKANGYKAGWGHCREFGAAAEKQDGQFQLLLLGPGWEQWCARHSPATYLHKRNNQRLHRGTGFHAVNERDNKRQWSVCIGKYCTCIQKLGLQWEKLVSVETVGCPNLTRKNIGLLKRMQDKVTEINPEQKLLFLHCITHQEVLCKSVLKINHVVDAVTKAANFIRARALNHRQFVALLEEHETYWTRSSGLSTVG